MSGLSGELKTAAMADAERIGKRYWIDEISFLEARLNGILFLQRDVKLVEQDLPRVFQPAKLQKVSIVIIFICGLFLLLFRLIDFTAGGSLCHSWHLFSCSSEFWVTPLLHLCPACSGKEWR